MCRFAIKLLIRMKAKPLHLAKLTIFILISTALFSCKKDYFDNINRVEASGEWGIPLINTNVYVKDLISFFTGQEAEDGGNGLLKFSLVMDSTQLIKPIDLLKISDKTYYNSFSFPSADSSSIPYTNEFQMTFYSNLLDQDEFVIEEGIVRNGTFDFTITTNIDQPDYTITIESPNLFDAQNSPLQIVFTPSTLSQRVDVSGCKFVFGPSDQSNTITFITTVRFDIVFVSPNPTYYINTDIVLNNLSFKSLTGKMPPKSYPIRFENPISIFSGNLTGNFTLLQPKYSIKIGNSIQANSTFISDSVGFLGENTFSPILPSGTEIFCAASPGYGQVEITVNEGYANDLHFSENLKGFLLVGDAIINPQGLAAGSITIDEQSELFVTSKVEVFFESKFDHISYQDTMDFALGDVDFTSVIEEATFRLGLTNGIPLAGNVQIYFYDTVTHSTIDTLFINPRLFNAATVGPAPYYKVIAPAKSSPQFITFEETRFKKLKDAHKMIIKYKFNSDDPNKIIRLYDDQKLDIRLGVKVKYNTNSLEL